MPTLGTPASARSTCPRSRRRSWSEAMLSASAGIGSRKNICPNTQAAGQAYMACPAVFPVWILKVFSLSMATQPLSCCLKSLITNSALSLFECFPQISPHDPNFVAVFVNVRAVFTMIGSLVLYPAEARHIDFVTGLQFFRRLRWSLFRH